MIVIKKMRAVNDIIQLNEEDKCKIAKMLFPKQISRLDGAESKQCPIIRDDRAPRCG